MLTTSDICSAKKAKEMTTEHGIVKKLLINKPQAKENIKVVLLKHLVMKISDNFYLAMV
jgi:hypothetical protein